MMMKNILTVLALLAFSADAGVVKMATEAQLVAVSNSVQVAKTNAIATANAYTDAAIASAGVVTPGVVTNTVEGIVPVWARQPNPPTVTETDPTVPAWAKQPNPPEAMSANALVLTNGAVKTKDGGSTITAAQVGAHPNNWMPTAAEVGAIGVQELTNTALRVASRTWDAGYQILWEKQAYLGGFHEVCVTNANLTAGGVQ